MTDPHCMVKLDPKGTVGRIYAGDHKTLLYTICINHGPHYLRKDFGKFLSMRAVDHQFAPKGSTRSIRLCHILYGFRRFFCIIHVATLIPGVWPFFTPEA